MPSGWRGDGVDQNQNNLERRDGNREADAVLVVVRLHDGCQTAADAQPVAAHDNRVLVALRVGEQRAHRLAVFRAELEDVPDFDAAYLLQHAFGVARRRVARLRDAQVRPNRFGEVAPPADMNQVRVRLVRARDEVL
jgi:hypothetical protein